MESVCDHPLLWLQYRIDDSTLRQLFMSYFTSPPDRRGDVALLLASILEYGSDDMEKVRLTFNVVDKCEDSKKNGFS